MALNERLQALAAFEDAADFGATAQHLGHREEGHSLQIRFANDILAVISVLRPKNHFLPEHVPDLVMFHIREVMPSEIAKLSPMHMKRYKDRHETFTGVHSFLVATVPVVFRLGQFIQV